MNTTETSNAIRGFITDNFLYTRPDMVVGDHDPLLGTGIIDSMGVMELVMFLEEEFGVQVNDWEMTEANLGSIAAVAALVESKRTAVAA